MFAKPKALLGLDVGTAMVKAVEFTFDKGNLVLSAFGMAPVKSLENVTTAINEVLRSGKFTAKRVNTALSGRGVVVRYFPLPGNITTEQALKAAVDAQSKDYIPFNESEVEKDFCAVPVGGGDKTATTRIILVAAKIGEVDSRVKVLRENSLVPTVIDIDTFAIGNAFEFWCDRDRKYKIDNSVTALVDIGATKTTINIITGRISTFSREVYIGATEMANAIARRTGGSEADAMGQLVNPGENYDNIRDSVTTVLEDIGNEIRLSIDFFENQFESEVSQVFVSGGVTRFPGLVDQLGQIFYLPTSTWNPIEMIPVGPGVDERALNAAAPHLAVAVGLAARIRGVNK